MSKTSANYSRPGPAAATLLSVYDFTLANKLFCFHLISSPATEKGQPTPFSSFLSLASYLYQHAYRSTRATLYASLSLLILLILVEDAATAKLLCENTAAVRLCRQRQPYLPIPKGERPYAAAIIDAIIDGVNHNLRRRLDTGFYM